MNLKTKIILFFVVLVFLLLCLFAILWGIINTSQDLTDSQTRHFEARMLAEELRRSSDELTRMSRTYAVTGDPRFLEYFKLISAIRDGMVPRPENYRGIYWDFVVANKNLKATGEAKVPITDLIKELHCTDREISLLSAAKRNSDELIKIETEAFNALKGLFLGPDGTYSLQKAPDKPLALRLLFGPEYHQSKAKIMGDIDQFFQLVGQRTLLDLQQKEKQENMLLGLAVVLSCLLLGQGVLGYYLFQKDITVPLIRIIRWTKRAQKNHYKFDPSRFNNDEIGTLANAISAMAIQIEQQITALELSAITDPLTRSSNRVALDSSINEQKYRLDRYGTACAIIMLDVDHFKDVNDRFGHVAGDEVLVQLAKILSETTRASDVVGRWGGEEFMIICPSTDIGGGGVVAELIRERIAAHDFGKAGHVTVSLGVSSMSPDDASSELAVKRADQALYRSKESGRNRVSLGQL